MKIPLGGLTQINSEGLENLEQELSYILAFAMKVSK